MRILILGANQGKRYNRGHQLFKDKIALQHDVRFYGEGHEFWSSNKVDICQILEVLQFQPDVILTYMGKYCKWVKGLSEIKIPKVHVVIDYFPWNYEVEDSFIRSNKVDLTAAVCMHEVRTLQKKGFQVVHLPFGVDTDVFRCNGQLRNVDVMAVFSVVHWAYPSRSTILDTLQALNLNSTLRASWPKTRLWNQDYVDALCKSRIVVNGVDKLRSLNWKFLEPCACGAMLLTEEAEDMAALGFADELNCVVFNGMADLRNKVRHYLSMGKQRDRIAEKGHQLVVNCHSLGHRVKELSEILVKEFGIDAGGG